MVEGSIHLPPPLFFAWWLGLVGVNFRFGIRVGLGMV